MPTATLLRMARQPIFDRSERVAGYELLYREPKRDDKARSARSLEAVVELGFEKLVGRSTAFLNIGFDFIDSPVLDALPSERLVLEISPATRPSQKNLERVMHLAMRGYMLALDGFSFQPRLEPFLEHCRFVKIDCSRLRPKRDREKIEALATSGKCVLACGLESTALHKEYRELGCHLFQGRFFAEPTTVEGAAVASNRAALMAVLTKVHREDVSLREIERIVASDVTFTYKLMKLAHSALIAAPSNLHTVGQAIQFLGLRSTAAIASILAISAYPGKPGQLTVLALARGKMCEELARTASRTQAEVFFTAGLLSPLDAFLNRPMNEIVAELPLCPEIADALVDADCKSELGRVLACAKAHERGDFDAVDALGFDAAATQEAYERAVAWADATFSALREVRLRSDKR